MKRGQEHIGYIILVAIILVAALPVLYFSLGESTLRAKLQQSEDLVNHLAFTANAVHNLGRGNKESVLINVPPGIQNVTITGKEIGLNIGAGGEISNIKVSTVPDVIGNIPLVQGSYIIPVKAINDTLVIIGPGIILTVINPACIGVNQMPMNISVYGDEFIQGAELMIKYPSDPSSSPTPGAIAPYPGMWLIKSPAEIIFTAQNTFFFANPVGDPWTIYVRASNGDLSNGKTFNVKPGFGSQC